LKKIKRKDTVSWKKKNEFRALKVRGKRKGERKKLIPKKIGGMTLEFGFYYFSEEKKNQT